MAELRVHPETGLIERVFKNGSVRPRIGTDNGSGHLVINTRAGKKLVHRMLWESVNGSIPFGLEIDHINGNKKDNRIVNLRLVSRAQNAENRHKPHKGNTSGVKGVSWYARYGCYVAQICTQGRRITLGYRKTLAEAEALYIAAAAEHHTHNPSTKEIKHGL
jgi:HNH endonuclease/AP2 domain